MCARRRKIFYVPGLISLFVVPFLLIQFDPLPPKQTVLRLFVPSDKKPEDERILAFTSMHVKEFIKTKKQLSIDLNGDHESNERKLRLIETDAQRLEYYNDTTTVIKVNFSEETAYGEFVELLDILTKNKIARYAWVDDSMIIFGSEHIDANSMNYL